MKLAVFGGTGKTGQHVLQQALAVGHLVTALARRPERSGVSHPNLTWVTGSLHDADRVAQTIDGADAVISVLGPAENKPTYAISAGMAHILNAMTQRGVRRLIVTAGAGVRVEGDRPKPADRIIGALLRMFARHVAADMECVVELVRASDLDWTVVRVPRLTDRPASGKLKIGMVGDIDSSLSRADLAAFILDALHTTAHHRKLPAISS